MTHKTIFSWVYAVVLSLGVTVAFTDVFVWRADKPEPCGCNQPPQKHKK